MAASEKVKAEWHAKTYSLYRRDTPVLLAEKIISCLKEKYDGPLDLAVDAGCGSGQGTVILAPFFKKVHGMDVSEDQIEEAKRTRSRENVTYEVAPAEIFPFPDKSVQVVTASSALHWFQLDVFFPEVRRVLCNNGILAVFCYYSIKPLLDDPAQTAKVDQLFVEVYDYLKAHHAPQAMIAIERYKDIKFPFEEVIRLPDVRETFEGQLTDIVGHVSSFSGIQSLRKKSEKEAEEFLSNFQRRLEDIVTACNIPVDKTIQLYRDYLLILCRKVKE